MRCSKCSREIYRPPERSADFRECVALELYIPHICMLCEAEIWARRSAAFDAGRRGLPGDIHHDSLTSTQGGSP